jgi:hypothetical protein
MGGAPFLALGLVSSAIAAGVAGVPWIAIAAGVVAIPYLAIAVLRTLQALHSRHERRWRPARLS